MLERRTSLTRRPRSRSFYVLIVPSSIALLIATATSIAMVAVAGHGHQTVHEALLSRLMYFAPAGSLITNCLTTGLIIGKLYAVGRKGSRSISRPNHQEQDPYTRLILALVEGGFLYSISLVIYVTLYALKVGWYSQDIFEHTH